VTVIGLLKRTKLASAETIRTSRYAYEVSRSAPTQVKCSATLPADVKDPCAAPAADGAV